MKFKHFTTEELQEIASLIAGRSMVPSLIHHHGRDDILKDIYDAIIIELRERRTADDGFQTTLH